MNSSHGEIWGRKGKYIVGQYTLIYRSDFSVSAHLCTAVLEQHYILPNMSYSHDNVRSLEQVSLKGFLFNPNPPCDLPFASLKTLCFFDCVIDDETLKALVSKFPILEGLTTVP
ncbi:hypothetical protein J1N35_040243 [Gossypium stocksii]|uniref:Uncharacterized protein n=1 Tax=Gossypium stocksii TaxID=47602 RepID=A0A9D3ZHI8_9ROSI|nr:hypothetical protein J1N35_040243 [Gossypium stocksii]